MKTNNSKISWPAVFMYSAIAVTAVLAALCFYLYYSGATQSKTVLWLCVVTFVIFYQFSLRIGFGELSKHFKLDYYHPFYRQRNFEKKLYKLLKVRKWKDKVLTFDPAAYDFQNRTLSQLATTMCKSELDHWFNILISVIGVLFGYIWGCFPAFIIVAVGCALFDGQFIVVQRYNRPVVLRLMKRKEKNGEKNV